MKKRNWILLSFFCWNAVAAQTDTLKKFPNGNILRRHMGAMQLLSPGGAELGSWMENVLNIKKWEKSLSIVRKTDSTGKRRTGMFDQLNGVFILPMEYEQLIQADYNKGIFETRVGNKYGYFNAINGKKLPAVFDFARKHLNPNWFIVCVSGAYNCGYVYNDQLQLVDSIPGMKSVRNRIVSGDREWLHINMAECQGLLDKENKLVFRKEWMLVHDVKGMTAVVNNGKGIGLFNLATGKLVKPYSFTDYWQDFFGSQGFLQKGKQWLLLDRLGKPVLNFTADEVEFSHRAETGGFYFKQKGFWGVMNNKGKIIRTPVWQSISPGKSDGGFVGKYQGQPDMYYNGIYKEINGEKVLVGIRQLTTDQIDMAYPEQMQIVQDESKEVIDMRNLPEATRPEDNEDNVFIKMEMDPAFAKPGENEKALLRQLTDNYKKEHKITQAGTVVLKLVVEKDGKISSTTIVSSPAPQLTEASKKLLNNITGWKPGIQNGRNVRGEKTLVFEW